MGSLAVSELVPEARQRIAEGLRKSAQARAIPKAAAEFQKIIDHRGIVP
jgi:hypothetical protein